MDDGRFDQLSRDARARVDVLVVEDEPHICRCLEEVLKDLGYRVVGPVGSAAEALALLERQHPDLALLDLGLRDGPATPVAEALDASAVPFVLMTGSTRLDRASPALQAAPRLTKPFGLEDLEDVLIRLLGRPTPGLMEKGASAAVLS
jgi:DNA-binding NtrC family response regulator